MCVCVSFVVFIGWYDRPKAGKVKVTHFEVTNGRCMCPRRKQLTSFAQAVSMLAGAWSLGVDKPRSYITC